MMMLTDESVWWLSSDLISITFSVLSWFDRTYTLLWGFTYFMLVCIWLLFCCCVWGDPQ